MSEFASKEQKQAHIRALLAERRGYEIHGNKDGLAAVDAELKRLGHGAKPPAQRSTKLSKQKKG